MVETLEQSARRGQKDIPPFGKIKSISYACQWGEQFGYPLNDQQVADYYVEYEFGGGKSIFWLIEGCKSHLHANLKQLETSAIFFKKNNIQVDGYLIVIDDITKNDKYRYSLKESTDKGLREIEERTGYQNKVPRLIYKKPVFVIFRKDFERLRK